MITGLDSLGLRVVEGRVLILDQELLPHDELWIDASHPDAMYEAIQRLKIRGAPLIGVAAALSLASFASNGASVNELVDAAKKLRRSRPTAVNLMKAVDYVVLSQPPQNLNLESVERRAITFFEEDVALCKLIGEEGAAKIQDGDHILTHCNSGGLATAGIGTAFGVIRSAHEQGKKIHVYVDETRPLLQGARLTTWELEKLGIPFTLICDNMAAFLMKQGKIQQIVVGADRIAANGDVANKVGTYGVAVNAKFHNIPFYVAAPPTTVDPDCPSGAAIPIEERSADEVRRDFSPKECRVYNPAFDVTPRSLVTAFFGCNPEARPT